MPGAGAVATLQSRTLATANPALKNSFNATKTRAQLEAMSVFSETALRIVGDVYDKPVNDAELALQRAKASGDAARIAQAEAALKTAQTARDAKAGERALAHGLVGGLTAALGGANPVSGVIGCTAGKLATTELEKLINESAWAKDPANQVAKNLLLNLTATSVGTLTGGTTGGFVASQGDRFNRQLHSTEIQLIKANAARYAAQQAAKGRNIAVGEAEKELAQQAYRQVQFGAAGQWNADAKFFLDSLGYQALPGGGYLFYATPDQRANPLMYADSLATDADFYIKNGLKVPSLERIAQAASRDQSIRDNAKKQTLAGTAIAGGIDVSPVFSSTRL